MTSDDSLLNEYEWADVDSYGSFNNDVHLDDDDEEPDGEYYGEADNDEGAGPISGMQFSDKDSLFAFYKEHARLKGFSVVKRNSNKKGGDIASYVTYCCDRARIRKINFTTKSNNCKARVVAVLDDSGCWRDSKVVYDHNHDLLPSISRLMAGHRSVCDSLKRDLVAHNRSGIRPSKNIRLVELQRGGSQNLGCTPKDCRNFILKSRNFEMQEGDAQSLLNFFREMQAAYEKFYDAICFDTTYLVNRYNMPCATFVGINHHRQSILLGYALMSHEDIDSYKLVFRIWLEAIGNVHPDAIITDQCQSIKPAITEVMPNTIHRCKGMHAFFDEYITRQSTLKMFVNQYELAIRFKHEKELEAKYRSKGFQIVCESMFKWEEQAIQCYTRTVYEFFKTQLRKFYHCEVSSPGDHQVVPGIEKFIVSDYSVIKK
uniref:Protein FAR1-RELATED SEQUENCE n=1 Tax=Nicotiana tabacum TaxID=4097 RepID=A0A1S3X5V6_TOBAC|nr:PREDICTED: protein FAR1-RELATED SEQUENCE 5-like [Nicotiana tabacum]